jgi:endonuclease/exonuclease/phosphatase family metal-dependent hydrolase
MTTLRLMTYNMLHAPGDRLASLAEVVKRVGPDILACQEVNTFEGMMALARELDMLPSWGVANSPEDYRDGRPVFEHLVVFTRMAPHAVRVHAGDRRAMFRPVLEVRLQLPGGPEIVTLTVHLRALIDPYERFLKFREVGALLAILADAGGPVIALGDFNALAPDEAGQSGDGPWRTDPPEDHLAAIRGGVIGAVLDAGLVDSYRVVHPFDGQGPSTLVGRAGRRLDHIFVSPSLRKFVSNSYIVDNEMVRVASDHRPVVTELTFGPTGELLHGDGARVGQATGSTAAPAKAEQNR